MVSEDNRLLYEGFTYKDKPYGTGVAYFSNGAKYQEGQFGIKGLLSGKEYYPNGSLRFEGEFRLNRAYGPNPPLSGSFYDSEGKLLYQREFKLHRGGCRISGGGGSRRIWADLSERSPGGLEISYVG
nr:hypothetical protein [Lachnospiraceae bacterium]